jgi:hypothetical protein
MPFSRLRLFFILVVLSILGVISCSPKTKLPTEAEVRVFKPTLSVINLPVKIKRTALNETTFSVLQNIFQDRVELEGGYYCQIRPEGTPDIIAEGHDIAIRLPLHLDIVNSSRLINLKANGVLELDLKTNVDIQNNKFVTKTQLFGYRWIKRPTINILKINLPIDMIANLLIKQYREILCDEIDRQLMSTVALHQLKGLLVRYFNEPFFTAEDGVMKVFVAPREIGIGEFETTAEHVILPATLSFENYIIDNKPSLALHNLSFSRRPVPNACSDFSMLARVPLSYVEQNLKEELAQANFGTGSTTIRVHDLTLGGQNTLMEARFRTSGAFNGKFAMYFTPEFDPVQSKLTLKDFQLKLVEGKSLSKSLYTLIKQRVSKMAKAALEEQLNDFLNEYLATAYTFISGNEIYPGIALQGHITKYSLDDFWIQQGRMFFTLNVNLDMEARINSIKLD